MDSQSKLKEHYKSTIIQTKKQMTDETMTIDKQSFKKMLDKSDADEAQIKELLAERKQLYNAAIKTFEVIGMAENGKVKFEKGSFSVMSAVGSVKDILWLIGNAQFSDKAALKLSEKFSYFTELKPLFEKIEKEVNPL